MLVDNMMNYLDLKMLISICPKINYIYGDNLKLITDINMCMFELCALFYK